MDNQGKTHNAFPWKKIKVFGGYRIVDAEQWPICDNVDDFGMEEEEFPTEEQFANAELIITAVNSHSLLLEACEEALELLTCAEMERVIIRGKAQTRKLLESAIKKAKEN